jgi:iron(III) transport system substrate-binding protein
MIVEFTALLRAFAYCMAFVVLAGACGAAPTSTSATATATSIPANAALVAAAKKEGSVTFYTTAVESQYSATIKAFKNTYGIDVVVFRAPTAALQTKFEGELATGAVQADVLDYSGAKAAMDAMTKQGVFANLADLPAWQAFPKEWRTDTYAYTSLLTYAVPYNTTKIRAAELQSWQDVVSDKWKGKIILIDPLVSPTTSGLVVFLDQKLGDAFIAKLATLQPALATGGEPAAATIAAGDAWIGAILPTNVVESLKAKGAPIDYWIPNPTTGVWHYTAAVTRGKNPNAGRLFMDFLLTKEGQAAYNNTSSGASALEGVPGVAKVPATYQPLDETYPAAERTRVHNLLLAKR